MVAADVATQAELNAVAAANLVLQVVNTQTGTFATTTATIPLDNTIPQIGEGAEFMTRTITPSSASSRLRIDVVFCGASSAANNIIVALFQGAGANALAAVTQVSDGSGTRRIYAFSHFMTAGTTSEMTFRVRAGSASAGTLNFNGDGGGAGLLGGVMASSITVTELKA